MSWVNIQNFDDKGFPISKVGFFRGGKSEPISQRYILTLNGVNSRIQTQTITLNDGDTVRFKATKPSTDFATVLDSISRNLRIRYRSGGVIQTVGLSGTVNGQPITSLVTMWPEGIAEFELTLTTSGDISSIGSRSDTDASFFDATIFDFAINDGSVYNYPIDDNSTTVIRNIGSGADATPVNVTPSMWSLLNV